MAQHEEHRVLRPAQRARRGSRYVASLDGLRALAVLAVIFYHMQMSWAPGGLMGVTVFFVISGYLITGLLVAEHDSTDTISLPKFWMRRVRRIIPAVLLAIAGTLVLCALLNPTLFNKARADLLPSLLFYNNWWQVFREVSYFEAAAAPSPFTHFWSLAIEEQFYIVWPIVLLLLFKRKVPKPAIAVVIGVLALASGAEMALLYDPTADPSRVYYGTDTRAVSLLIGALLAFVWPSTIFGHRRAQSAEPARRTAFNVAGLVALAGILAVVAFSNSYTAFPYHGGIVLVSLLTAVLIAVLVVPNTWMARLLQIDAFVWVGKRSYSMYLWHYPIILATANMASTVEIPWWVRLAQLVLIFAVSDLSYRFVENPIRTGALGRWWRARRSGGPVLPSKPASAVTAVCCAVLACAAVIALAVVPAAPSPGAVPVGAQGASSSAASSASSASASTSSASASASSAPASTSSASAKSSGSASASASSGSAKSSRSASAAASSASASASAAASGSSSSASASSASASASSASSSAGASSASSSSASASSAASSVEEAASAQEEPSYVDTVIAAVYDKEAGLTKKQRRKARKILLGFVGNTVQTISNQIDESFRQAEEQRRQEVYDELFMTQHLNKAGGVVYDPVLIGDSVAAGCENEFYKAFPNGHSDALVNRNIWESPYGYYNDNGQAGTYAVFCLGTNNAVVDEQIDEMLAAVPDDKKVILVNIRCPRDWEAQTNQAIASAAQRHDKVVAMVDWYAASAGHDEYFYEDGIHLNGVGAQAYIALIQEAIAASIE